MLFVALGLVTEPNLICFAEPDVVLVALLALARILPAVEVFTVHVPLSVDDVKLAPVTLKPVGVVQLPEAVVHISAAKDWKVAVVPVVKSNWYEVDALAAELPNVSDLTVSCAALAGLTAVIIIIDKIKLTAR